MGTKRRLLRLSRKDRRKLRDAARGHKVEARLKRRAQVILLCWEGLPHATVARRVGTASSQVRKWVRRFRESGVEGLADAPRSGRPCRISPAERVRTLGMACRDPAQFGEERATWSLEALARRLVESGRVRAISKSSVHRILSNAGLKPHKVRMWCTSTDPDYDTKLAEITGLYLDPPPGEPVVCIDEKTGMQALSRRHPLRRPRPGRPGREEFEYKRNGTRCLFACFNVRTGHVLGRLSARRKEEDFLSFLDAVAATYRQGVVHVVADNLNIHKGPGVAEWNRRHENRFRFHYTPTHGSWLNQVEIFFGILVRRVLRHASYGSTALLDQAVERFLRRWNAREAHPFRWTYRQQTLVA
jgi:transposase